MPRKNTKLQLAHAKFPIGATITNRHNGTSYKIKSLAVVDVSPSMQLPIGKQISIQRGGRQKSIIITTEKGAEWSTRMLDKHFVVDIPLPVGA